MDSPLAPNPLRTIKPQFIWLSNYEAEEALSLVFRSRFDPDRLSPIIKADAPIAISTAQRALRNISRAIERNDTIAESIRLSRAETSDLVKVLVAISEDGFGFEMKDLSLQVYDVLSAALEGQRPDLH